MEYGFLSRAGKFLQEQAKSRRGTMVFLCLAAGVTLGTLGFLKLYGQAMTHKVKMLDCQYEVHEHTEDCYEENEDGEKVLICGLADYVIHVHNDDCYDQKGELVCQLEEHELHEHDESCWEEEEILICEEEESEGSAADGEEAGTVEDAEQTAEPAEDSQAPEAEEEESGSNAETVKELACEKEEHKHDDSCYADGAGCEKEAHTHGDSCYEKTEELVCDASEHTHDDSCYTTGESELTCEESEHTHDDGCYDEEGNEVCGESEHTHDDGCYSEGESELTCGAEEHTHGDSCYEVTETLVCETEEHEHDDSCAAESELVCGIEEHEHDDSCYVEVEAETEEKEESESAEETGSAEEAKPEETVKEEDTQEKNNEEAEEGHTHTDDCYETREVLTCGELELHTHDADPESETCCYSEDCFDEEGSLIEGSRPSCGLLQLEEHIHTEECFKTVELTPEEIAAINGGATLHVHTDECYDEEGNLICGHEVTHLHQLECYDEDGNLICGFGGGSHVHEESCYDEEGNLICGYETATHPHTADCYDEAGNLVCGYETASHVHEENCYDEEGNLICGYETAAHPHTPDCYDEEGNLICGYETAVHPHTPDCYDEEGNLICGYETAVHVHMAECYDEEGNLICGYEAEAHEHDIRCYDEGGNLICGYEDAKDHEHDGNCYDEEGNLICGYEGVKDHEHDANCYDIMGNLICGYEGVEDHVHTEACYDEEGNLICGYEVLEIYDGRKIFESDKYIVVVKYNNDANIPEEAELIAEEITPDSDQEHYGNRETEYREMLKDETASMRALLKIGFYLEGAEIEPETPVAVSIQFIDEDGLAEGKPITVIHFAEGGTEKLDGSDAKDNSTSFKMMSFSEIAIGYGPEEEIKVNKDGTLHISNDFEFDADPFHMVFHVEGEAKSIDGSPVVVALPEEKKPEDESVLPGTEESGEGDVLSEGAPADGEGELPEADAVPEDNADMDGDAAVDENIPSPKLNFHVKSLDDDAELREALMGYLGEATDEVNRNILHTISYQMTYGDVELDLSNCVVTAEIMLGTAAPAAEGGAPEGESFPEDSDVTEPETARDADVSEESDTEPDDADDPKTADEGLTEDTGNTDVASEVPSAAGGEQENEELVSVTSKNTAVVNEITEDKKEVQAFKELLTDMDEETEISVMAIGVSPTGQMNRLATMAVGEEQQMDVSWNGNIMALTEQSTSNPTFIVQYYAYVQMMPTKDPGGGAEAIEIIDTVQKGKDGVLNGGQLPSNASKPHTRYMYVKKASLQPSTATWPAYDPVYVSKDSTDSLTKIYTADLYPYREVASGLEHINKFAKDGLNYDLFEVWVLKEGRDPESNNKDDWNWYCGEDIGKLVFRNNEATEDGKISVHITKDTVIRLVGRSNDEKNKNYPARFFDYDFTDGTAENRNLQGINNPLNYKKDGDKVTTPRYGFGNNSSGPTGLEQDVRGSTGAFINQARKPGGVAAKSIIEKCHFGLVESALSEKGYPVIKVNAPDLFNPQVENMVGRAEIPGYSLNFDRDGDTYTLMSVEGAGNHAQNLDQFQKRPIKAYGTNDQIWTNQFWPMDSAATFGDTENKHDPKFGRVVKKVTENGNVFKYSVGDLVISDDEQDHNSFFGMTFEVEFELTDDYVGPLNYYFFGDDDMWVFLEYPDGSTKLICDIGGVHQAAGEYVDLWNYIQKPEDNIANKDNSSNDVNNDNSNADESDQEDDRVNPKYKLKFFYTERGASGSTCWMQFTLPSVNAVPVIDYTGNVKSTLTLGKTVEGEPAEGHTHVSGCYDADGKLICGKTESRRFDFVITFKGDAANIATNDYPYRIKNKDGSLVESGDIRSGGTFKLGHGQTIEVFNLPDGTTYTIEEKNHAGYEPGLGANTSEGTVIKDQTIEGNIDWDRNDVVDYINQQVEYNLPETGGPGPIWYMIAGAFFILLGTGLMCNKKFSERRV